MKENLHSSDIQIGAAFSVMGDRDDDLAFFCWNGSGQVFFGSNDHGGFAPSRCGIIVLRHQTDQQ